MLSLHLVLNIASFFSCVIYILIISECLINHHYICLVKSDWSSNVYTSRYCTQPTTAKQLTFHFILLKQCIKCMEAQIHFLPHAFLFLWPDTPLCIVGCLDCCCRRPQALLCETMWGHWEKVLFRSRVSYKVSIVSYAQRVYTYSILQLHLCTPHQELYASGRIRETPASVDPGGSGQHRFCLQRDFWKLLYRG